MGVMGSKAREEAGIGPGHMYHVLLCSRIVESIVALFFLIAIWVEYGERNLCSLQLQTFTDLREGAAVPTDGGYVGVVFDDIGNADLTIFMGVFWSMYFVLQFFCTPYVPFKYGINNDSLAETDRNPMRATFHGIMQTTLYLFMAYVAGITNLFVLIFLGYMVLNMFFNLAVHETYNGEPERDNARHVAIEQQGGASGYEELHKSDGPGVRASFYWAMQHIEAWLWAVFFNWIPVWVIMLVYWGFHITDGSFDNTFLWWVHVALWGAFAGTLVYAVVFVRHFYKAGDFTAKAAGSGNTGRVVVEKWQDGCGFLNGAAARKEMWLLWTNLIVAVWVTAFYWGALKAEFQDRWGPGMDERACNTAFPD
jgi:hypothetical protein